MRAARLAGILRRGRVHRTKRQIRHARIALGGVLAIVAAGVVWTIASLPSGSWQRWVDSLPPAALFTALAVLPVFGFPISVLHIATGARFGFALGSLAVAASTLVHLLAAYALGRTFEGPLRRALRIFGWSLPAVPPASSWTFTLWVALLPGISYAIKNTAAPLAEVPLRIYLAATMPVHVATALVGLGIGHATMHFSWPLIVTLVAYGLVVGLLTRKLTRQFRGRAAARHGAAESVTQTTDRTPREDDQTSPA